jgi:hypothetical protein
MRKITIFIFLALGFTFIGCGENNIQETRNDPLIGLLNGEKNNNTKNKIDSVLSKQVDDVYLDKLIKILQKDYTFGNKKTDMLEYDAVKWKYKYKFFEQYAIFKMTEIHQGTEVRLTKDIVLKKGTILLIDINARKLVYQAYMEDDIGTGMGGGADSTNKDKEKHQINFDTEYREVFNYENLGESVYDYDRYTFSLSETGNIMLDFSESESPAYLYIESANREYIVSKHYLDGDKKSLQLNKGAYKITFRSQGKIGGLGKNYDYAFTLSCKNNRGGECSSFNEDLSNTFADAKSIELGEQINTQLDYKGDIDIVQFNLSKDSVINTSVLGKDISVNLYMSNRKDVNLGCRKNDEETGYKCRTYLAGGTYYMTFQSNFETKTFPREYNFKIECDEAVMSCSNTKEIRFPVDGDDWSVTMGSTYHIKYDDYKDDTFAIDLNLNKPSYNSDKGKNVYSILDGVVESYSKDYGALVIKHNNDRFGYSLYMHMDNDSIKLKKNDKVTKDTLLGTISDTGTGSAHLHFAIYKQTRISPVDIGNELNKEFLDHHIKTWFNGFIDKDEVSHYCNKSFIMRGYSSPWWEKNEEPCPDK